MRRIVQMVFVVAIFVVISFLYGCSDDSTSATGNKVDGDIEVSEWDLSDGDSVDTETDKQTEQTEDDVVAESEEEKPVECEDDGLACTSEQVINGICQHVRDPEWCIINNQCVARNSSDPSRMCYVCNPDIDPMSYVPAQNGTTCEDGNPCTVNDQCVDGVCTGSDKDCSDGVDCTVDSCDSIDGSCLHSPDNSLCNEGYYCDRDNGCTQGLCEPDSTVCVDDTHYQTCNADGSGYVEDTPVACDNVCYDGQCVDCTPNDKECQGNSPKICVDGSWNVLSECSGDTPICLNGTCVACTPGEVRCNGNAIEECNADGSWEVSQSCVGDTPVCVESAGTPQCVECDPASEQLKCEGNDIVTCGSNGTWTVYESCSDDTPLCFDGQCVECIPPQRACDGDSVISCVDGFWEVTEFCDGPSPACQDGACVTCDEGDRYCNGSDVYVCSSDGTWQFDTTCEGDTPVCSEGECVVCVDGQRSCNGQIVLTCQNGIWHDSGEVCIGETPYCMNGQCLTCIPGHYGCIDNSWYYCDTGDSGSPEWILAEECSYGEVCDMELGCIEDTGGNYSMLLQSRTTGTHASIPDADEFDPTGPITIEAWIYPTEIAANTNCNTSGHMIVEKWTTEPGGKGNYFLATCSVRKGAPSTNDPTIGDIRFGIIWWDSSNSNYYSNYTWFDDVIYTNRWSHVAAVWDEGEIRLYLNGVLMHKAPISSWSLDYNANKSNYNLQIGQLDDWGAWSFIGMIDEVRISHIARYTEDEFQPLQTFDADEYTSGLWHFDEGSGTNVPDASGNGNDATLDTNASWSEYGVGETP